MNFQSDDERAAAALIVLLVFAAFFIGYIFGTFVTQQTGGPPV